MKEGVHEYKDVWDAIEDNAIKAENMKLRAVLLTSIIECIKKNEASQAILAKKLGITQPRVSALLNGKIDQFRLDMLVDIAHRLGLHVELKVA